MICPGRRQCDTYRNRNASIPHTTSVGYVVNERVKETNERLKQRMPLNIENIEDLIIHDTIQIKHFARYIDCRSGCARICRANAQIFVSPVTKTGSELLN